MKTYKAGGTIRVARFVKISAAFTVSECDANERTVGISDMGGNEAPIPSVTNDPPYAAIAGESVTVHHQDGETCLLYLGTGGCTAGALLKSDADGAGVVIDETAGNKEEVGAIAEEAGSAGEYVHVMIRKQTVTTES
jgi:hypothetical protein